MSWVWFLSLKEAGDRPTLGGASRSGRNGGSLGAREDAGAQALVGSTVARRVDEDARQRLQLEALVHRQALRRRRDRVDQPVEGLAAGLSQQGEADLLLGRLRQ